MLAEIGLVSLFLSFVASIYALAVSVYSTRRHSDRLLLSARNAGLLTFPLLTLSCLVLWIALVQGEYQISYVWSVSNPETPLFYRLTALWGSQKGSLLFWCFLMSAFAFGALILNWRSHYRLMPYVIAYLMATQAFFIGLVLFMENPFERWWLISTGEAVEALLIPANAVAPSAARLAETANGLNPLLRHFGMIIHPPMLYLGFVGMVVPFAFAMAALASGDLSTNWIKATRRWALVGWLFLSLGLILGGRWAYDVLGWGGYWGWDPVENAAFLPWLIGTAFIHSVMIQEKRGMLKVWNMFLVIGTFSAVMFGTFATRSGLIDSVHAFARSEIGLPMFLFWAAVTLISVGLILWRWNRGELKDEHPFVNILSRESLFVLNNVIFVLLFVAIFWGSFGAPVISELFFNEEITLGREYFERVTPPLFVALYILMGIAPLSAWGATSLRRLGRALIVPLLLTAAFLGFMLLTHTAEPVALIAYGIVALAGAVVIYETYRGARARRMSMGENWLQATLALFQRNRRRYGGYIVHLGITVIGIGVIGSTLFQQETQQTLAKGESVTFGGYVMTYDNFTDAIADDGRRMEIADVTVSRNGQMLAQLRPRHDVYPDMPMTIAGSYSTLEADFYVLLVGWEDLGASSATFKIYINPLVNLIWWGSLVLMLGTFISAWPHEQKAPSVQPAALRDRRAGVVA